MRKPSTLINRVRISVEKRDLNYTSGTQIIQPSKTKQIRGRNKLCKRAIRNEIWRDEFTWRALKQGKRYYLGELSRFVDTDYQSVYHIKWRCNLSRAPWWDGHFEGLVGAMKQAIYKSIGRGNLRWKELEKVLQNVETTVNN